MLVLLEIDLPLRVTKMMTIKDLSMKEDRLTQLSREIQLPAETAILLEYESICMRYIYILDIFLSNLIFKFK